MSLLEENRDTRPEWVREDEVAPHFRMLETEVPLLINNILLTVKNQYSRLGIEIDENAWIEHMMEQTDLWEKIKDAQIAIREAEFAPPSTNYYVKEASQ